MAIQELRHDLGEIKDTIRNFQGFFNNALIGATDIDFCYERHGNFLFLEEKGFVSSLFEITYGQYLAMQNLHNLNPSKVNVWYVFRKDDYVFVYKVGGDLPRTNFNFKGSKVVQILQADCIKTNKAGFVQMVADFVKGW